jgi:hypothetical protein
MPNEWRLYNDAGQEIDGAETGLGRVPIVIVDNEEGDQWTGQSLVRDIAYLDRAIFNNWSRLDVIVNEQTFSQLVFPVEGLPPEVIEDEKLREKFLKLAVNRVLLYSANAAVAPSFISPDASQAEFILTMIERQVKQLYASLGLQNETGEQTTQAASGVAKAFDFDKLGKLLAAKADNLEEAETQINELFGLWTNINAEVITEYPDEFDVRALADEIAMAQELTLLEIGTTFKKEIMKQVALKALPKLDNVTKKKIIDEIESMDDEDLNKERFDFDQDTGGANRGGQIDKSQAGGDKENFTNR